MADFLILMHSDYAHGHEPMDWNPYLLGLSAAGALHSGSVIGGGFCVRNSGAAAPMTADISGYIRIVAPDLEALTELLAGNPVYEAGGTIEIRELPKTD